MMEIVPVVKHHQASTHRPWPIPASPWVMRMRWRELLFAHWAVDPSVIRSLVPLDLELDLFEGRCYVGAVPFLMDNVTPRLVPPVPGLHAFPELNLRTYVKSRDETAGKPGVWFFSLDAGQKLAVRVARRFFHLPYFHAKFHVRVSGEGVSGEGVSSNAADSGVEFTSERTHKGAPAAMLSVKYAPIGPVYQAAAGTLDAWLAERYCLYAADRRGIIYRCEIDHAPWPLQKAKAEIQCNTLGDWLGIELHGEPETLHFAKSLDVHAWMVERI